MQEARSGFRERCWDCRDHQLQGSPVTGEQKQVILLHCCHHAPLKKRKHLKTRAGAGNSSHHFRQQDGGLPDLPEQGRSELRHRQRQELRDERPDTRGRRRLRECRNEAAELRAETERGLLLVCGAALQPSPRFVLQREFPVPEQFKTVWDGSKLVTEPTEIAG